MSEEVKISIEIAELTNKLFEVIEIFKADRQIAIENLNFISDQLIEVTKVAHMSEDARLEREKNNAVKLVFASADRLEMVVKTITEILINQMSNESRERIASKLMNPNFDPNTQIPQGPVRLSIKQK